MIHFNFSLSGCNKLKKLFKTPKFQHLKLFALFVIFSVILLSADIVTDIIAAVEFFQRGDTYWFYFTLIPVFAPLGVRVIMMFYSFCRCLEFRSEKVKLNRTKLANCFRELRQLHWHIPLLQPIRFAKYVPFNHRCTQGGGGEGEGGR